MRRCALLSIAVLVCLSFPCGAVSADPPAPPVSVSLENEFVCVVVNRGPDEAGRFSIHTTGGDPSRPASKNKHLIYGGNKPWTSYTTVRIDGVSYVVGGPTHRHAGENAKYGETTVPPTLGDRLITYSEKFGDLEVTQELGFVRGLSTRMLDTIGITYKITNHGTASHQTGLRVLLDTQCGDNDGAAMRAGRQAITTATMLTGSDIPDFWQAFDSLTNPSVISQGSLRGANITTPDKALFADWGTLAEEPWEPVLTPGQGFIRKGETDPDSAMAMIWNPVALEPGKSLTYVSYYGIGEVSLKPGNLTLGLTAPAETTFAYERTQTVTFTGYLQNAGGFAARDVTMTLEVPKGLTLVAGDKTTESIKLLKPDDTLQRSWIFRANGEAGGTQTLKLSVASSNIEANQITRDIDVIVPVQHMHFQPAVQRIQVQPDEPQPVILELNLSPAEKFTGFSATLQFDPNIVMPLDLSRGRAFVDVGNCYYWHVDKSQINKGLLTLTGRRIDSQDTPVSPLTQAEINLATMQFRTVNPGKMSLTFTKAVLLNDKGEEQPVDFTAGDIEVVSADTASPK